MAIATQYFTDLLKFDRWLAQGIERARLQGGSVLVSYSQPAGEIEPVEFFARARGLGLAAFFWERAEDNFGLAGAGSALQLRAEGAERFKTIEAQWHAWLDGAIVEREDSISDLWGVGPALVGGFAFDTARPKTLRWEAYPDGSLHLPQVQLVSRSDGTYLTLNALVEATTEAQTVAQELSRLCRVLCTPGVVAAPTATRAKSRQDVLPSGQWQNLVGQAVEEIKAGLFQKVVLAREVRLEAQDNLDPALALQTLRQTYPSATIFAVAQGGKCFLGATPERLVRLCEGEVRTIGLAGSAPRGQTSEEDARLGRELLDSPKNQEEHAIVVRMLRTALEKVCRHVWAEEHPHLLKLSNVQHLYTPVLGRLAEDAAQSVLTLVEALHPTPALGGYPRREALAWLREHEELDRGWYAAPVGWVDSRGEGEFVVAIRSALLEGNQASLYAGCGIVADSDPASEYAESCLKLKPMLSALGF